MKNAILLASSVLALGLLAACDAPETETPAAPSEEIVVVDETVVDETVVDETAPAAAEAAVVDPAAPVAE